jgi:N4-gp56 family major capsid protein
MAISKFIPEVWSAKLLLALRSAHVYAAGGVINREYEGEISDFGDTVHITSLVDPTIGDYTAHTDITVEDVDDLEQILQITQSKYFAFEVDDIEKRQAKGNILSAQAQAAAWKLRDVADRYVAGLMATGVAAQNVIAETTVTKDNAYDILVDLGTKLDESNIPTENRWAVITPKFHGLLLKDSRFIAAGDDKGAGVRTNGLIGEAAGFTLRKSNNVPDGPGAGAGKLIIAGNSMATTFAEQIAKTEAARRELRFADMVKGLHLYGGKVVRPEALAAVDAVI